MGTVIDPLQYAGNLAREAGALLLERIGHPLDIREKSAPGDLVTIADRASEALIVERLRSAFPRAVILGEEGGLRAGSADADERWIVDPLDGTTNYAHGYPLYCVSIAYERNGEIRCGAIFAPVIDELYLAELGSGATCNGRRLQVSAIERLADALLCTGFMPGKGYERNGRYFAGLSNRAQAVRRDGAAALDLAFVAAARYDAFWEFDLNPWDIAAGALIIRESGGHVSAIDGSPLRLDGKSILASNSIMHQEMLVALSEAGPAR